MLSKSDRLQEPVHPEDVLQIIQEVGKEGWIKITFSDERGSQLHPVVQIGNVDDGGLEITTIGQKGYLNWDDIESVEPGTYV